MARLVRLDARQPSLRRFAQGDDVRAARLLRIALADALGARRQATSYYDTSALKETLERLVDFDRINALEPPR